MNVIEKIRKENTDAAEKIKVKIGDTVSVHVRIKEGDKERTQVFKGTVISVRHGRAGGSFTVRRISHGVGVERVFPLGSSYIAKVDVEGSSMVRRAKLYYLRDRKGKQSRLAVSGHGSAGQ